MKVFQFYSKFFTLLSMFPSSDSLPRSIRIQNVLFSITGCIILIILSILPNGIFIIKYVKSNLIDSLDALYQLAALIASSSIAIILFISRRELIDLVGNIQKISDDCKCHDMCFSYGSILIKSIIRH